MTTLFATASAAGSCPEAARKLVAAVRSELRGEPAKLLFLFASTEQPLAEIAPLVAREFPNATLVGCSTAGEVTHAGATAGAATLAAIGGELEVAAGIGTGLRKDVVAAVKTAVGELPARPAGFPHRTAIVLLDGLAGVGEEVTLTVASELGVETPIAGAAAGDDMKLTGTYVACNARVATDAVVVATIDTRQPLGLAVAHGHVPLSGPLRVTRSNANVVLEIEGRPAWEVWVDETRRSAERRGIDVNALTGAALLGNFLGIYEAGIETGAEFTIRVPLAKLEGGALAFSCGMPEGTVLRIMDTSSDRQTSSAREAFERAIRAVGKPAGAVIFDCRARRNLLAADYGKVMCHLARELDLRFSGFSAYGEVGMNAGDLSGFHNTTAVVLAFPK